jgi:hypothetical protein
MAVFPLFGRPLPIHFALLGRKRKKIKSKTTAKLIEKRKSIAAVRDKLGQIVTFLTPLLSGCRLPLKMVHNHKKGRRNHSFHNAVRLRHYSNMKAFDPKNYFYTVHFFGPF